MITPRETNGVQEIFTERALVQDLDVRTAEQQENAILSRRRSTNKQLLRGGNKDLGLQDLAIIVKKKVAIPLTQRPGLEPVANVSPQRETPTDRESENESRLEFQVTGGGSPKREKSYGAYTVDDEGDDSL
jgi:hypothetical protein